MKMILRDRSAARAVLEAMAALKPRRVVMAHGVPIEDDVPEVFGDLIEQLGRL